MSRRLIEPLPNHVTAPQRLASDPRGSAWVRANAGSGKTHVLTERVMRLLLAGVRPEEILCLTYTKAAAAEMRRRVSARLAEWALLPEAELAARLTAMEGTPPSAAALARARTLFAHALETPGGLKINTIHAFCESVLHRFPLEAGVPFDFRVIEEVEADTLIRRTREAVIAEGLRGGSDLAAAVETLFGLVSDHSIALAIDAALAQGRRLRRALADRQAAKARLRRFVAMPEGETRAGILRRAVEETLFPPSRHDELFAHLPPDPGRVRNRRFVDWVWECRTQMTDGETRFSVFLKDDGSPYADRRTARIKDEALAAAVGEEHDRLAALYPALRRATLVERSVALLDLVGAIVDRYEAHKRARSWLDFDDLIEKLGDLFGNGAQADWVRYKLDAGLTHILVDESQDTNPEQWRVVRELVAEFFVGDSAVERPRTLFAVGDEKQSIYSFQGADPTLFGSAGRAFRAAALEVGRPFAEVPLHTSFRTLPGVLEAVDLVFANQKLREAVLSFDQAVGHQTARAETGGLVTLWPPIQEVGEDVDGEAWPLQPAARLQRAPRRLAERIAREIRGWIEQGRPLGPRGRPVRAEDVLILVQTRSALFDELIRALGQAGIPTPGADRLPVTGHIAVLDLLALGDVLLNPTDDLQLAALLRSPLFDIAEDGLFAIAHGRVGTLWQALETNDLPAAREAFARLHRWRTRLDFGRPFEFYAEVLYRDAGLRRFHGRLGGEIDDVVAEFLELALAHEQTASPSLHGFLAEMRAQDISIKRDLAEPGSGVRVMTVHGAKGLEAPIVILADAASRPGAALLPPVFVPTEPHGPLLVYASGKDKHTPETLRLRDAAEQAADAEYWRKLYVGMTRAEDELYITGYRTGTGRLDDTWYAAVEGALEPVAERVEEADGALRALVYPRLAAPLSVPDDRAGSAERPMLLTLPPLAAPAVLPLLRPSAAYQGSERVFETAAEAVVTADQARRGGIALHALLQHLGRVPPDAWQIAVDKALPQLLPDAPADWRAALGYKAVSILGRPEFAELFGPDSRAEVPFLLAAMRHDAPVRLAGRIDRIVVAKGRVLVVDYKSDAVPAGTVSEVPASYLTQVGLYAYVASQLFPGLAVEAGILWTNLESLMILPVAALRDAVSAFTMR
ncbi:MAG: double-strand break repair helicase AddA [Devosia sp.]|nr:double-strand break repair helicase AddA [Devosia sp.]